MCHGGPGLPTVGFAVAALIAETVWALLVPAMAGLVLMWALALLHDAGYVAPAHGAGHAWAKAGQAGLTAASRRTG